MRAFRITSSLPYHLPSARVGVYFGRLWFSAPAEAGLVFRRGSYRHSILICYVDFLSHVSSAPLAALTSPLSPSIVSHPNCFFSSVFPIHASSIDTPPEDGGGQGGREAAPRDISEAVGIPEPAAPGAAAGAPAAAQAAAGAPAAAQAPAADGAPPSKRRKKGPPTAA